jgi:photosystem II stability/assembly factor-like uncharacterized protein
MLQRSKEPSMKRSLVIVPLILAGLMVSSVAAQDKSGSDGKSPWESLPIVAPKGDETFHCIAFVSREVGYVAGTKAIYKTEDGCKTWKPVFHAAFLKSGHIDFLRFQDAQHGWLGCNSKVYFTEDGGASWEPVDAGLGSADIAFGPGGWILVVGGKSGVMQRRGPKGKWEPLDFARAAEWNGSFHAVRFVAITGEQSALVVLNGNLSSDCRIMRTTDGGKTWKEVLKREFRIQGMHFTDARRGWLIAYARIFVTDDGGESWKAQINPEDRELMFLAFAPAGGTFGVAPVASAPKLVYTTDGKSWRSVELGLKKATWQSASVVDNGCALVLTEEGRIIRFLEPAK